MVCCTSLRSSAELSFAAQALHDSVGTFHFCSVVEVRVHCCRVPPVPVCVKPINGQVRELPAARSAQEVVLLGHDGRCRTMAASFMACSFQFLSKYLVITNTQLQAMDRWLSSGQRAGFVNCLGSHRLSPMASGRGFVGAMT